MTGTCRDFQSALESKLSGLGSARELCELSWHEHVLACVACRTLLQEEEALEVVLSTLPDPVLPAELAERVLARLRTAREDASRLEELLEVAGDVTVPAHLGSNVLDRLRASRPPVVEKRHLRLVPPETPTLELDELLDLDREFDAPPGLGRRVLAGLTAERGMLGRELEATRARRRIAPAAWAWPLAAGVLVLLGWFVWDRRFGPSAERAPAIVHVDEPTPSGATPDDPDQDLLAALDVLEEWNSLMQDDLDVDLSTFDPTDEILLEYSTGDPLPEIPGTDEPPSKG